MGNFCERQAGNEPLTGEKLIRVPEAFCRYSGMAVPPRSLVPMLVTRTLTKYGRRFLPTPNRDSFLADTALTLFTVISSESETLADCPNDRLTGSAFFSVEPQPTRAHAKNTAQQAARNAFIPLLCRADLNDPDIWLSNRRAAHPTSA